MDIRKLALRLDVDETALREFAQEEAPVQPLESGERMALDLWNEWPDRLVDSLELLWKMSRPSPPPPPPSRVEARRAAEEILKRERRNGPVARRFDLNL